MQMIPDRTKKSGASARKINIAAIEKRKREETHAVHLTIIPSLRKWFCRVRQPQTDKRDSQRLE
jgi:hypothetical protein